MSTLLLLRHFYRMYESTSVLSGNVAFLSALVRWLFLEQNWKLDIPTVKTSRGEKEEERKKKKFSGCTGQSVG